MELELRKIAIRNIEFGSPARIEGDTLIADPDEMRELILEDSRIKDVSFDIALPGSSTRILPVKDVIEPRAKPDGRLSPEPSTRICRKAARVLRIVWRAAW